MELNHIMTFFGLCLVFTSGNPRKTYTHTYHNLDLDEFLNNERVYRRYLDCFVNNGSCTPDAKELKGLFPDALKTECSKCTDKQRLGTEKVIRYMAKNRPKDFIELESIYDKDRVYRNLHNDELNKLGVVIPGDKQ